jgi:hypothetical protein
MSEDMLHFSVCFNCVEREYLSGSSYGCPNHGTLETGRVLNAAICLGCMDTVKVNYILKLYL